MPRTQSAKLAVFSATAAPIALAIFTNSNACNVPTRQLHERRVSIFVDSKDEFTIDPSIFLALEDDYEPLDQPSVFSDWDLAVLHLAAASEPDRLNYSVLDDDPFA